MGHWMARLATFGVVLAVGLFSSIGGRSYPPSIGFRTQAYRGVAVTLPAALVRVHHDYVSECDALTNSGVYDGRLSDGGSCESRLDPDALSVTLSPLDAHTTQLSTQHLAFVSMRIVRSRHVAIGVWYGRYRAADAAKILASVRPT